MLEHRKAKNALRARNADDLLPLHQAAAIGEINCVRALLDADPSSVDLAVRDEGTAAHIAAEKGHSEALDLLLSRGFAEIRDL
jgi:ankyrin repeat protein